MIKLLTPGGTLNKKIIVNIINQYHKKPCLDSQNNVNIDQCFIYKLEYTYIKRMWGRDFSIKIFGNI